MIQKPIKFHISFNIFSNVAPDVARLGDLSLYKTDDDEHVQQIKIVDVIKHPDYTYKLRYNDLALMKLERNAE